MVNEKDLLSIEAAKLYYELDQTQQQIAQKLNISRPTVSKLLKHAKDQNFIQIKITNPFASSSFLEEQLQQKFQLKAVKITPVTNHSDSKQLIQAAIAQKTAQYLHTIIKNSNKIGISWGETLYHVSKALIEQKYTDVEILQLKGGMNFVHTNTHDQEIMMQFVKCFHAKGQFAPLPVIFNSVASRNVMLDEKQIQHIYDKIKHVDIALYTIGKVSKDSLLYKNNYITEEEFSFLEKNAICDICSHFINEKGEIASPDLDIRTFGISLDDLKKVPQSILIAHGDDKLKGMYYALKHNIPNVLITDSLTAQKLLEF